MSGRAFTVTVAAGALPQGAGRPSESFVSIGRTLIEVRGPVRPKKHVRPSWRRRDTRGLSVTSTLPLPGGRALRITRKRRTYAEAVDYTPPSTDALLDMLALNFDRLAAASIRHHLATAADPYTGEAGRQLRDVHDRLTEPRPKLHETDEDRETKRLVDTHRDPTDPFGTDLPPYIRERQDAVLDRYRERQQRWLSQRDQARHDFIDQLERLR